MEELRDFEAKDDSRVRSRRSRARVSCFEEFRWSQRSSASGCHGRMGFEAPGMPDRCQKEPRESPKKVVFVNPLAWKWMLLGASERHHWPPLAGGGRPESTVPLVWDWTCLGLLVTKMELRGVARAQIVATCRLVLKIEA